MDTTNRSESTLCGGGKRRASKDETSTVTQPPAPSHGTKCSPKSEEELFALSRAAKAKSELSCPLCKQSFPLKKSLLRHIATILRQYHGERLRCGTCGAQFARLDILNRHKEHKHGAKSDLVSCENCGLRLRPRSLKGHQLTRACREATGGNNYVVFRNDDDEEAMVSFSNYFPMSTKLHDILECTLLSGWLFAKIRPWGEGQHSFHQWLLQTGPAVQTYEIRKLKALVLPALRTATAHPDADTNGNLLDAILLLTTSTTLTDGWDHTPAHQGAILWLAQAQLSRRPVSRDEFIGRPLCDAFSDVVFNAVRPSQRWKCMQVLEGDIRVMRAAAYDYVERLTQNFSQTATKTSIRMFSNTHQPADFAASYGHQLIEIGSIAASVDETEPGLQ